MSLGADACGEEGPGPGIPAGATTCAPQEVAGFHTVALAEPRPGLGSVCTERTGEAGSGWGTVSEWAGVTGRLVVAPVNMKCAFLYPCRRVARRLATSPPDQKGSECLGYSDGGGRGSRLLQVSWLFRWR